MDYSERIKKLCKVQEEKLKNIKNKPVNDLLKLIFSEFEAQVNDPEIKVPLVRLTSEWILKNNSYYEHKSGNQVFEKAMRILENNGCDIVNITDNMRYVYLPRIKNKKYGIGGIL